MISLRDCIDMSGLTEEEVLAIAEHEHVSEMIATGLANYLSTEIHDFDSIRDMIVDDIRNAQARQDQVHVRELLHVLHHFLRSHPDACPEVHPWSAVF